MNGTILRVCKPAGSLVCLRMASAGFEGSAGNSRYRFGTTDHADKGELEIPTNFELRPHEHDLWTAMSCLFTR